MSHLLGLTLDQTPVYQFEIRCQRIVVTLVILVILVILVTAILPLLERLILLEVITDALESLQRNLERLAGQKELCLPWLLSWEMIVSAS